MGHTSRWQFRLQWTTIIWQWKVAMDNDAVSIFLATFGNLSTSANVCQQLETLGNFWELVASFGYFWQLLIPVGNFWHILTTFSKFWQLFPTSGDLAIFDNFWQHLATFVILFSFHLIILSSCHIVIFTYFRSVLLSSCQCGSLSICQLVNLIALALSFSAFELFSLRISQLGSLFYILEVW